MRFVAVTEGDKTEAEAVFGVQVNTWGVNDLVRAVDDATDADEAEHGRLMEKAAAGGVPETGKAPGA